MKTRIVTHYPGYGCAPSLHKEQLCDVCDTWSIILHNTGFCPKCGCSAEPLCDRGCRTKQGHQLHVFLEDNSNDTE